MPTKTRKQEDYATLSDLPGRPGQTKAVRARSIAHALRHIRAMNTVTAANSCGSITVWYVPEEQAWRGEFSRLLWPLSKRKFETVKDVHAWLQEWWPQMLEGAARMVSVREVAHAVHQAFTYGSSHVAARLVMQLGDGTKKIGSEPGWSEAALVDFLCDQLGLDPKRLGRGPAS